MDDLQPEALELLHRLSGDAASFREHQLEAIRDLVEERARVLCVQRTGWGKSAVYFIATALLRARGAGPTLIVSPLLALMRDQLEAASRLGLRAHTVNSTNREEWHAIEDLVAQDAVDLLLISPERLNNVQFREQLLGPIAGRIGLLVIDEAHCVSDWGHDFRPDYRRIRDLLAGLQDGVGVLATTATANDRVVGDVLEQLAGGGHDGQVRAYRGPLTRASLRLEVVALPLPAQRLAWLASVLPTLDGSGIVYCLTKRDCVRVAGWLERQGISALAYSGDQETEERLAAEARLKANDVKAIVATSALGMGYDKPDLGFVVHYQAPGSVISYYQQIGRAGRGVAHADAVLLRGAEDARIQDFFIDQAFPPRERVEETLHLLQAAGPEGLSVPSLLREVNLGRGRMEGMLKILDVEGAVTRNGSAYVLTSRAADWTYDEARYRKVTEQRRTEQAAMAAFGADGRCLMRVLQEALDDPAPQDCGRCAVCTAPRFAGPELVPPHLVEAAERHLRAGYVELAIKRRWPATPDRAAKNIPEELRLTAVRALARRGDGGWDRLVDRALASGTVDDELVEGVLGTLSGFRADLVTTVPSRRPERQALLGQLAVAVGQRLGVPARPVISRIADRPPMRELRNASTQFKNLSGALLVEPVEPGTPVLLLDDESASGWTLAMAGGQLRHRGAGAVLGVSLLHQGA